MSDSDRRLCRALGIDFEEWDERAAIMEYDGGLSKASAEHESREYLRQRKWNGKEEGWASIAEGQGQD